MATSWSATSGNSALSTLLTTYPWIKFHVGQPGATGLNNPAGETTRQQATWTAPAGGSASNSAALNWTNVAATETYAFFTAWTASSGGTFGFSGTVTASQVIAGNNFQIPIGSLVVSLVLAS